MGWTSFPLPSKPDLPTLNAIVDKEFLGDGISIIDRSGWQSYNHHRYTLIQLPQQPGSDEHHPRLICVTLVEYRHGDLYIKTMEETEGPFYYDCPQRLIKEAETTTPLNDRASAWRTKVTEKHQRDLAVSNLLKTLRAEYPNGDRRLIVAGKEVTYHPATRRRKRVHTCYHPDEPNLLRIIAKDQVDLQATSKLREQVAALPA